MSDHDTMTVTEPVTAGTSARARTETKTKAKTKVLGPAFVLV